MGQRIKFSIGVLILIVLAILLLFNKKNNHPLAADNTLIPTPRLSDQVRDFPGLSSPVLSEAEKASACRFALEAIETKPLNTLVADINTGNLRLDGSCLFLTKNNIPALQGFPENCATLQNGQPTADCVQKLFYYKALRIHYATINDNLENLSNEVMINKYIGLIADQAMNTPSGMAMMRVVGLELYRRFPNSEPAGKAAALPMVVADNLTPEEQVVRDQLMDELRNKFPQNWEIYEMDLVRRMKRDMNDYNAEIERFYTSAPNSSIANYYMGCNSWRAGQRDQAMEYFQRANTLTPSNPRFTQTWQLASQGQQQVCSTTFGFDPNQF